MAKFIPKEKLFKEWNEAFLWSFGYMVATTFHFLLGKWGNPYVWNGKYRPEEGCWAGDKPAVMFNADGTTYTNPKYAVKVDVSEKQINPKKDDIPLFATAKNNPLQNGWLPNGFTIHFLLFHGCRYDSGIEKTSGKRYFSVCWGADILAKAYFVIENEVFKVVEITTDAAACDAWFETYLETNPSSTLAVIVGKNELEWKKRLAAKDENLKPTSAKAETQKRTVDTTGANDVL